MVFGWRLRQTLLNSNKNPIHFLFQNPWMFLALFTSSEIVYCSLLIYDTLVPHEDINRVGLSFRLIFVGTEHRWSTPWDWNCLWSYGVWITQVNMILDQQFWLCRNKLCFMPFWVLSALMAIVGMTHDLQWNFHFWLEGAFGSAFGKSWVRMTFTFNMTYFCFDLLWLLASDCVIECCSQRSCNFIRTGMHWYCFRL